MARGFLLHTRPFRESSLIATFMTDSDGRQDLIARSARTGRKRQASPPLPFCLYELSWTGRGSLRNLQFFEPLTAAVRLGGQRLYCGFYLNELLYRLLKRHDPEPLLLEHYAAALQSLADVADSEVEPVLRRFELVLLAMLGYGLDLSRDETGRPLQAGEYYVFTPETGLRRVALHDSASPLSADGRSFLAIGQGDFVDDAVRRLAKTVLRTALAVYLGSTPLRSRALFSNG